MQDNKTFFRFLLAFAFLSTCFFTLNAQTPLAIDRTFSVSYIQPEYWIDSSLSVTFSRVHTLDSGAFRYADSPFQSFGKLDGTLWVRWSVDNQNKAATDVELLFNRKDLDTIQVWQCADTSSTWTSLGISGDQVKAHKPNVMLSGYHYTVSLSPGANHFYARIQNQIATSYLMLELYSTDAYLERNRMNMVLLGLYTGIIIIAACICLTLYYLFRNTFFLYFVLYALNMLLWEMYNFSLDGGLISLIGRYSVSMFIGVTYGLFFLAYLKVKKLSINTWWLISLGITTWTLIILAIIVLNLYHQTTHIASLLKLTNITLFLCVLVINAFLIIQLRHSPKARILFFAGLPIGAAYTALLLRNLGQIDNSPYFHFFIPIGFMAEVVFFSLAFATFFRHQEIKRKLLFAQISTENQRFSLAYSQASVNTKDRIAREINESMVAELAGIEALNKSVLAQARTSMPDAIPLLEQISRMSRHVNESVSDLIWAIRTNHDPLNDLAERIKEHSSRLLGAKDIHLILDTPQHLPLLQMSTEARQNIYLIFKENLNNALKYSHCTKIHIRMNVTNNLFEYEFSDNGVGFNTENTTNGMGLRNIQKRASEIGADISIKSSPSGTRIMLTLDMSQHKISTRL